MMSNQVDRGILDYEAYEQARNSFRQGAMVLPGEAVNLLAEEVVIQLVTRLGPLRIEVSHPTPLELEQFCNALLSDDEDEAARIISAARREGVPLETLYLGYLSGASVMLGERWEDDRVSFIEMTAAAGRIFAIMRGLRHIISASRKETLTEKYALFATVPGDTHTLGVTMAADLFRNQGWEIDLRTGLDHAALVSAVQNMPYRIIGLSAGHPNMMAALARIIVALRISHPMAHILVSGQIVALQPNLKSLIDADSVVSGSDDALKVLQRLS